MGKKRNNIIPRSEDSSLTQRQGASGEEEGAVRASPVLETEMGHVEYLVLSSLCAACRQQGRKKRPWFGILRTALTG